MCIESLENPGGTDFSRSHIRAVAEGVNVMQAAHSDKNLDKKKLRIQQAVCFLEDLGAATVLCLWTEALKCTDKSTSQSNSR